jgi:thiol:disulfide interchange protein
MTPHPCKLHFLFSYLTELIHSKLPTFRSTISNLIHISILNLLLAIPSIQATETDLPTPVASPQSGSSSLLQPLLTEKPEFLKDTELLPPDSAFLFSAQLIDSQYIQLDWQIAPGYYLYSDKIQFSLLNGGQLGQFQFPPAQLKEDLKLGQTSVYENHLSLQLPINNTAQLSQLTLQTTYQGCAEARLCYPPIEKITQFPLPPSSQNSKPPVTDQTPPSESTDPDETSLVAAQTRSRLNPPLWNILSSLGKSQKDITSIETNLNSP